MSQHFNSHKHHGDQAFLCPVGTNRRQEVQSHGAQMQSQLDRENTPSFEMAAEQNSQDVVFILQLKKLGEGEGFDSNMCSEVLSLELCDESTS